MCRAIVFEAEALIILHFHMALDTDKSMNVGMLGAGPYSQKLQQGYGGKYLQAKTKSTFSYIAQCYGKYLHRGIS
jgi:hypothetical protein